MTGRSPLVAHPPPGAPILSAMGVLAHLYLRYDRAAEAAALLAALARLSPEPLWAQRTRCLALLRAGEPEAALAEAGPLLPAVTDSQRAALLVVMAQACWRLGDVDGARAHMAASAALTATMIVAEPYPRPRRKQP